MKKSRFSEQQIAFILKQVDDGVSVEEVCRKAGISQQTYYRYTGADVVAILERVCKDYGLPKNIRVDNDPDIYLEGFRSMGLHEWCCS